MVVSVPVRPSSLFSKAAHEGTFHVQIAQADCEREVTKCDHHGISNYTSRI